MRALGVHTYLGAFQRGVESVGLDVVGSAETWPRGQEARKAAGDQSWFEGGEDAAMPRVDLVFANPPCSRFSHAATYLYSTDQLSRLDHFPDLKDVHTTVERTGAEVAWWETGPLCATLGTAMVRSIHGAMAETWGSATTLLIRHDCRAAGVPQFRPRCHVVHLRGDRQPRVRRPLGDWPPADYQGVGPWIGQRRGDVEGLPCVPRSASWEPDETAVEFACRLRQEGTFSQGTPKIVSFNDGHSLVVLTGRRQVWGEADRWWTIEELSTLQGYPPDAARRVADRLGSGEALAMLSKGVCAHAAADVWRRAIQPTLDGGGGLRGVEEVGGGVWELTLTVPREIHRALPRSLALAYEYGWEAPDPEQAAAAIRRAHATRARLEDELRAEEAVA